MTLQQLKYVSMVERCGSFSKAAQKLYVSQPSVSNLVHGLEELHITIFQRTPSGVVITNEGRELLKLGEQAAAGRGLHRRVFPRRGRGPQTVPVRQQPALRLCGGCLRGFRGPGGG